MMTFQMILIGALVSRVGFMEAGSPALSLFYAIVQPIGSVSISSICVMAFFYCLWRTTAVSKSMIHCCLCPIDETYANVMKLVYRNV